MLFIQNLNYAHSNKDLLFSQLNLAIHAQEKVALVGNNGSGKSTLLKLIAGILPATDGTISSAAKIYYVPQLFTPYNELTIAQALGLDERLQALYAILAGAVTETNLLLLNDDWGMEERCQEAFSYWGLGSLELNQAMNSLSGGQKTKVFLAGIMIHQPEIVLLDEPSNHLDVKGRALLYQLIRSSRATLVVVSHDRLLLNLLNTVYELDKRGITTYGGNYDFYTEQKELESKALQDDLRDKEKALRKAKEVERDTAERRQRLDARGKKKQEKAGLPTISMNTLRNQAEKSTSKLKTVHTEKTSTISEELKNLRKELPDMDQMIFGFDHSALHKGKILIAANDLHFGYDQHALWKDTLNIEVLSGERIAITGSNGSGKTSLIRLMLGEAEPTSGIIKKNADKIIYIDQEYSLVNGKQQVYEQAERFNTQALQEHEVKLRLARFLFNKEDWDKPCDTLSGGEKMRLILCCLTISQQAPDMIILDEPTNNLDIRNLEILTKAINSYEGTVIVVSHDTRFLEDIGVERAIEL